MPREGSFRSRRALVAASVWVSVWPALAQTTKTESTEAAIVEHFRAGQAANAQSDFDRAAQEYKKVLALAPSLVEARVNLGLVYHSLAQYALATKELSAALRERPGVLGANLILGIDYLKLGAPEKAIAPLSRALELDRSNQEVRKALAAAYLGQDSYDQAEEQYLALFSLELDKTEAWYTLGRAYLEMTTHLAQRVAPRRHESAWVYRLVADFSAERGSWKDAAQKYQRALELEPGQAGLHCSLGYSYLRAGKLEEAEEEFRHEIDLDRRSERAWLGTAEGYLAKGLAKPALEAIAAVFEISPEFLAVQLETFPASELPALSVGQLVAALDSERAAGAPASFLLSSLYRVAGNAERAKEEETAFRSAITQVTANSRRGGSSEMACAAHQHFECAKMLVAKQRLTDAEQLVLGKAQLALGEYQQASVFFIRVLSVDKDNLEAAYWLIRTYQTLASNYFDQVENLWPDSWRAHQVRGDAYRIREADTDAIREYERAVALRPDALELYEALGELYLNRSFEQAKNALQKALDLDPRDGRALFLLGRAHARERDWQKAVLCLEKALKYQPDLMSARAILGNAYLHLGNPAKAIPELEKAKAFDYYGSLYYQLSVAYGQLGKVELAQRALARSRELRRESLASDQAKLLGGVDVQ